MRALIVNHSLLVENKVSKEIIPVVTLFLALFSVFGRELPIIYQICDNIEQEQTCYFCILMIFICNRILQQVRH